MKKFYSFLYEVALVLAISIFVTSCAHYQKISPQEELSQKIRTIKENNTDNPANLSKELCKIVSQEIGIVLEEQYYGSYDSFIIYENGSILYPGYLENGEGDSKGFIIDIILPPNAEGLIIIIESENHYNFGNYSYPDYNESNPHKGCYIPFYLKKDGEGFSMAQGFWNVPKREYTACAMSLEAIYELFDLYGYDSTCKGYSSSYKLK